jgi:hypothetical protein
MLASIWENKTFIQCWWKFKLVTPL